MSFSSDTGCGLCLLTVGVYLSDVVVMSFVTSPVYRRSDTDMWYLVMVRSGGWVGLVREDDEGDGGQGGGVETIVTRGRLLCARDRRAAVVIAGG